MLEESLAETFKSFDVNNDGSIQVDELRAGLNDVLRSAISQEQAEKVMRSFDTSGDGALQLDEFKGVDAFRNKLDKILLEEKNATLQAQQDARAAQQAAEKAAERAKALQELVNNQPPTTSDKILSLIPYLLPLADVLPSSRVFIENNDLAQGPIFEFAAAVYVFYDSIPFGGLVAFFLFNAISSNLRINRLVRFNIQQAIFLDIALIFPGLIGGIAGAIAKQTGTDISPVSDVGSTIVFLSMAAAIVYSMISSLLGIAPDKIPLVSERVRQRVPTAEEFENMFDENGNFVPPGLEDEKKKPKDDNDRNSK